MQLNILLIISVIGVLGMITCTQAVPIDATYTGDSCDCPKKLNYLVNMPQPPMSEVYKPSEYGYNLEWPLPAKAQVTYSFDFMVDQPKTPPPPPEVKLDLFAKIDRITARKQDCYASEELPKTCGCQRCDTANRYVSPESSTAARFTRNLRHSNSIDKMAQPTSQIVAIFLEPLKQTKRGVAKSRNKRDLSRIFMRPRKNQKRSDRLVKQYNKHLKDLASEKTFFDDTRKTIKYRTAAKPMPAGIRPLQQLGSFLNLPGLRNKRDIKGEYDLIEKEREQMDLTLPEIIQYMPETLDPSFKRDQCHFGKSCQHHDLPESTTKTATTIPTEETNTTMAANENKGSTQDTLSVTEANSLKVNEQEKQMENSISLTHTKRNTNYYSTGCPLVFKLQNPTPKPGFTYEPLTNLEAISRPLGAYNPPYAPEMIEKPLVRAAYVNRNIQPISNYQLDRIIAAIVNKHSDFIQASSHPNGALVEPSNVQKEQAKYFLKSLKAVPWNDWLSDYHLS